MTTATTNDVRLTCTHPASGLWGDPFIVTFRMENLGTEPMAIEVFRNRFAEIMVNVINPGGAGLNLTPYGWDSMFPFLEMHGPNHAVVIPPGDSYEWTVDVARGVDTLTGGPYTLKVQGYAYKTSTGKFAIVLPDSTFDFGMPQ